MTNRHRQRPFPRALALSCASRLALSLPFAVLFGAAPAEADAAHVADASATATADPTATTTNSAGQGSEILVTGTRRAETSVKNTPMAISAFSGAALAQANVTSIANLASLDPSVNIQSYGAGQQKIVLRGISSNIGTTTALYLDEAAVVGGQGANIEGDGKPGLQLYDIDHIEVLKGPQGTLFGTSSMSGTLRVITHKPVLDQWGASLEVGGASVKSGNPMGEADATINAPLVKDVLALRVTGWTKFGGGYVDQQIGTRYYNNNNDAYIRGFRAEMLLQASERFSLLGEITHQQTSVDGSQAFQITNGPYLDTAPTIESYKDNYTLYTLTGTYDTGAGSLIATGDYTHQRVVQAQDSTPTNYSFGLHVPVSFIPQIYFKDFNAELRFSSKFAGPFQIVAGGYYEYTNTLYQTNAIQTTDGVPDCFSYEQCHDEGLVAPGHGNSPYEFGTDNQQYIKQYAVYAQGDYHILSNLTATVGARYFHAQIHDVITNLQTVYPDFVFGEVTTPSVTADTTGTNHKPSFNFALLWQPTREISLYARAASGYRIGGVNTATSLAQQAGVVFPATYKPDNLWSYEAGVKGYVFDRKVYFDLSAYRVDWSNEQLSAEAGAAAFDYTINAGKTVSKGVEFTTTVKPVTGFSVTGDITYVDARLAEDLPTAVLAAGTYGYKGDRVPLTPKWSAALNADYQAGVGHGITGFLNANVTYRGGSWSNFDRSNTYDTYLPAYTMVGAQVGLRKGRWELTVYGQNLTDIAPYLGVVASEDGTRIFTAPPRTVGAKIRVTI